MMGVCNRLALPWPSREAVVPQPTVGTVAECRPDASQLTAFPTCLLPPLLEALASTGSFCVPALP